MEKEDILRKVSSDVKKLEKECNHYKLKMMEKKAIKNLKISIRMLKLTAPCIFIVGIVGIIFPFLPGSRSSNRVYAVNKTGKYYFSDDFKNGNSYTGLVKVCGNAYKIDDGTYQRNISWYNLSNLDIKYIDEAFDENNLDFSKLFGESVSTSVEASEEGASMHIELFRTDSDGLLIFENPIKFLIYLSLTLLQIIPMVKGECSISSFDNYVSMLEEKYKIEDLDVLKKKLAIRKDNYRKFFSDNNE